MSDYYDSNSGNYFESTFRVDPSSFLEPLINKLKAGSTILDIGCGSGRDLLWLKNRGFNPTGLERAPTLAKLAREHTGCPIIEVDFQSFDFGNQIYDALLLVGAMVHLGHEQFAISFASMCSALKSDGYVLITMKEGEGIQTSQDGRVFTLWQQSQLESVFLHQGYTILDLSIQVSKIRKTDIWLGYLLQKKNDYE
jgi:cyclopropane fatty-acyl-phospholipid synthase-like methyltransferase